MEITNFRMGANCQMDATEGTSILRKTIQQTLYLQDQNLDGESDYIRGLVTKGRRSRSVGIECGAKWLWGHQWRSFDRLQEPWIVLDLLRIREEILPLSYKLNQTEPTTVEGLSEGMEALAQWMQRSKKWNQYAESHACDAARMLRS